MRDGDGDGGTDGADVGRSVGKNDGCGDVVGRAVGVIDGEPVGEITSGAFGPTTGGPVAMGYVAAGSNEAGTAVQLDIRGKAVPATVTTLPFTPRRYFKN